MPQPAILSSAHSSALTRTEIVKAPGKTSRNAAPRPDPGRAASTQQPSLPRTAAFVIERATRADTPPIARLLQDAGLPYKDFAGHIDHFLVARSADGAVVGAIGAEVFSPDALLRSLVVEPAQRGRGLGNDLLRGLEVAAETWGVRRWWLLTTTAGKFFVARGFVAAARTDAPPAIQASGQFSGGCSCSAICLTRARRRVG